MDPEMTVALVDGDRSTALFDVEAVGEQLERVLASDTFAGAPRARALISFVVTETVTGRAEALNERVITRVALGKPAPVDTRTDASGRVQASRARDLLDRYYAGEGRADPIVISIPRGQYGAVFTRNSAPTPSTAPPRAGTQGPVVAVANLAHGGASSERRIAFGLAEVLVQTLASFPGISVAGPISLPRRHLTDADVTAVADRTGAAYILHGRVQELGSTMRISMRLVDPTTGVVTWAEHYDRSADAGYDTLDDVAAHVAGVVGDFNGVVLRGTSPDRAGTGDPVVAEALRRYFAFLADLGPESEGEVVESLVEALDREPNNVTVMGCLASIRAVAVLMRGAAGAGDALLEAERLARQVLDTDPSDATAHNVLAVVMLARGRHTEADQHARRVLELTPFHPGNIYAAGMVIGASGDWDGGIQVIRRSVSLNPYGPSHHRTLLAVDALLRDDLAEAVAQASLVRFPGYPYGPLLRYLCLSELGLDDDARHERDELVALVPFFFDDPAAVLSIAPTLPPHVVDHLVARLGQVAATRPPENLA